MMLAKLANRWDRLKRLEALKAPKTITDEELKLIAKSLDELYAWSVEHGIILTHEEAEALTDEELGL